MSFATAAIAAGITAAGAIGGAAINSRSASKARKANNAIVSGADKAGAFRPLAIAKPERLNVPAAESILSSWRGEVSGQFPAYDAIADKLNVSEQDAARYANTAANPNYYNVLNQLTSNALQASRGEIPADVRQNVLNQANEDSYLRGFSYGTPSGGSRSYAGGNEAAANLALRNLGLTSLDMMKYGDQLGGQVMDQSRASRGTVMSAKDVVPTSDIFGNQMNAGAMADYNYRTDKQTYTAARKNAPIQAAYNKLALQMGVQQQNNALSGMAASNNAQLAMSAAQALGSLYQPTGTIGAGRSVGNTAVSSFGTPAVGWDTGVSDPNFNPVFTSGLNQPVASASSIRAISARPAGVPNY
jgi:hypothetical protein